ncbi:hypothetical protein ACVBAX_21435 [Robertmurraya sp. GLU-23]
MQDKILDLFKILFEKMWGWIYAPFKGDLDSLNTLIYKNEDKYYGIFSEEQFGVVAQGMAIMQSLSVGIILVSIIIAAMRISSSGINPSNRTSAIEYFKDFIIVALLFFNLSTIFELIFAVNSMFVNGFSSAKAMIDGNTLDKVNTFFDKGVLGGLIIGCILLGLWIWANFFYMMRTLTLMLLMIISPVAVALYLVPQTKGITLGVFKEFTGTVLVQSIHAFTYWVITAVAKDDFGLGSVILYIIFIPITESIRSLIGLGGQMNNNLSRAASMMGGAAIMGMYASVKGALNGESFSQAVRRGLGQGIDKATGKGEVSKEESDNPKGILAGAGTDVGSTERAERMLKSGEVTSKMGKAVFGMAGALAGSPMGPMGSAALGQVGFAGGGVVGGLAGRSGMAGIEGLANRGKAGLNAFKDKFKGVKNAEDLADEKLANTLADNEANAWASDNKESFMKGLKERFPDADDHSLNKMWDKEVSGKKAEFLKEARSTVGEMKSTSGKVAKASDLIDSTVNNLTNDWAKNNKDSFMREYDVANPLPVNASEADIRNHNNNKNSAWDHAVQDKKNTISAIATNAVGKLGLGASNARAKDFSSAVTSLTNDWAKDNKEAFMKDYDSSNPLPPNATEADRKTHNMNRDSAWNKAVQVKKDSIGKSLSSNLGSGNVASAVTSLTNDWAKNNKESFMKDYDSSNPLPPNSTEKDLQTHKDKRNSAWDKAVQEKKISITKTVSSIASNNLGSASESILVNKEEFVNEIGSQVGSVIGKGAREGILAVKGATSGVQNASLYSGKAVHTDFVASHLATMKTNGDKESYIESAKSSGMTESQAIQQWNTKGASDTFAKQYSSLMTKAPSDGGLPRHIPLDHKIIGGNNVVKGLSGVVAGAVAGAGELTGITPTAKFISDTKLAAGAMGSVLGAKEAWTNRSHSENIMTSGVKTVGAWGKSLASHYQAHVPENVVEKQANFRNANAYLNGVVGGVRGYKMGASSRTPYDQLVNDQVKEVSEIQQMVQMVGPKGQEQIAAGAIRMVTTRGQSVIQVKDKTGNIQTVSRIASGDSSLPKGETIFQDLAIQDGQLTTASNVYKEDSGGGKVTLNRSINVNPNRIIANRNTPQNPRVVQEVQSYNQLVDSGQYTQKQAIAEMTDIRMVVDRNRSYLIGKKDGSEYRISPYGRGDARLTVNEVVERPCETVQSTGRLVVKPNDTYTSSTQPDDIYNINELLPRSKPNKRNMTRQLNEKFRNKSFTESLKG